MRRWRTGALAALGALLVLAAVLHGTHGHPAASAVAQRPSPGARPAASPVAHPTPSRVAATHSPTGVQRGLAAHRVPRPPLFRPGVVLLAFRSGTSANALRAIEAAAGVSELRTIGGTIHVVRVERRSAPAAVRLLRRRRAVRYAELDYTMHASATPDDPSFGYQWGLHNTGQSIPGQNGQDERVGTPAPGTAGADVGAPAAWNVTTGSRSVVIGETDTGVDYNHPDLAANVWSNPGGIGGCTAGSHGYNEVARTCDPMDDDAYYGGHGTHVAGIMGALGNNSTGVAGVNWSTTILPVKWLDSNANGTTDALIAALDWLVKAKQAGVNVRVVNDSATFVGTARSQALSDEIDTLGSNGILFVTAAGNTGPNNDDPAQARYPCTYDRSNELCVTATDNNDQLPSWAGYGANTVDLAAPGTSIYSTLRGGNYGYLSGGSMAAAMVSGSAGLILAAEGNLSVTDLKARILDTVDPLASLAGKVRTGGRLDLCRALRGCGAPLASTGPATQPGPATATLNATVNPENAATTYHFQYGTTTSYGAQAPATDAAAGSDSSDHAVAQPLTGLAPNTAYHYRVVATNTTGTTNGADQTFTTRAPPAARTDAATAVTPTGATLNATVNPENAATTYHFQYGTTTSYGAQAPPADAAAGSDSSDHAVAQPLTGLAPNTAYHYRVVATNTTGTTNGADQTFTTHAPPPAPASTSPTFPSPPGQAFAPAPRPLSIATTTATKPHATPRTLVDLGHDRTAFLDAHGRFTVRGTSVFCGPGPCRFTAVARLNRAPRQVRGRHQGRMQRIRRPRRRRATVLGSATWSLASGHTARITIRLTAAARRMLARTRSLTTTVTLAGRDRSGALHTRSVRVTVRLRRTRRSRRPEPSRSGGAPAPSPTRVDRTRRRQR